MKYEEPFFRHGIRFFSLRLIGSVRTYDLFVHTGLPRPANTTVMKTIYIYMHPQFLSLT